MVPNIGSLTNSAIHGFLSPFNNAYNFLSNKKKRLIYRIKIKISNLKHKLNILKTNKIVIYLKDLTIITIGYGILLNLIIYPIIPSIQLDYIISLGLIYYFIKFEIGDKQ